MLFSAVSVRSGYIIFVPNCHLILLLAGSTITFICETCVGLRFEKDFVSRHLEFGTGCKYSHSNQCKNKCRFTHPRLCVGSLKNNTCYRKECFLYHVTSSSRLNLPKNNRVNEKPKATHVQDRIHLTA